MKKGATTAASSIPPPLWYTTGDITSILEGKFIYYPFQASIILT